MTSLKGKIKSHKRMMRQAKPFVFKATHLVKKGELIARKAKASRVRTSREYIYLEGRESRG